MHKRINGSLIYFLCFPKISIFRQKNLDKIMTGTSYQVASMITPRKVVIVFILQQCMRSKKQSPWPSLTCCSPMVNPVPNVETLVYSKQRSEKKRCNGPSLQKEKKKCRKIKRSRFFLFCVSFIGQLTVTV